MTLDSPAETPVSTGHRDADGPPVAGRAPLWLILLWGLVGFAFVFWANDTPRLPAPHADSMAYMEAARAIAAGGPPETSFVRWDAEADVGRLAHFPPGTSVLVAIPMVFGLDPVGAATLVLAICAGALFVALGLLGGWVAGWVGAVVVPAVLLFSPELARLYVGVWSEPVFLAVAAPAALAMWRAPGRPGLYGLLAAAALTVRYAGVPLVALAVLMAARHAPKGGRAKATAWAGGPGLAFLAGWWLWSSRGGEGVRSTGLYAEGFFPQLEQALGAFSAWGWSGGGGPLGGWLLLASAVLVARRVWGASAWAWIGPVTFAVLYLGFIGFSRLVADPHIPFDERLLAPMMVGWLALLAAQLVRAGVARTAWRLPLALTLVAWIVSGAREIRGGLESARTQGMHYSSAHWDASPLFEVLTDHDGTRTIYSNEPELVLFRTGARARRLPRAGAPYDQEALAERLSQPDVLVVLIPPFRQGELTVDDLVAQTVLQVEIQSPQGWLLSGPPAAPVQYGSAS